MAKKDIGKILTSGSPKQRINLIMEDIARGKYLQEKLLTDSEFNQLSNSFKKPNEIKLWNEYNRLDGITSNALINLQGLKFDVLMRYSNLRGYILQWNAVENAEILVNSVLHEIKDIKERKRIAKEGAKGIDLLFTKTEPDQEGYIELKINFEENYSLWFVMNNVKKEVETSVIKYLSWEKAILDFMEDNSFNVKTYKAQIKRMSIEIYSPIIHWSKYLIQIAPEISNKRLEETQKKYAICPNVETLEIDTAEYNWYRTHFLDGDKYPEELRGKVNKPLSYE